MSGLQLLLMVFVLAYIVFLLLREKIRADVEIARASAPPNSANKRKSVMRRSCANRLRKAVNVR